MDTDLFREVLEWACQSRPLSPSAAGWASWIDKTMKSACNLAARKIGSRLVKPHTFWWSDKVAAARRCCIGKRRAWIRAKRTASLMTPEKYRLYRIARNALRLEIRRAKAKAWSDLVLSVEDDPWGLPYKLVMGRLRASTPGLSASLPLETLSKLIEELFPTGETHNPAYLWNDFMWDDSLAIVPEEVISVMRSTGGRNKDPAPGPDGVRLSVWRKVPHVMIECLAQTLSKCLAEGVFPLSWKRALLTLIPKNAETVNPTDLPRARPICLLGEAGKIFERILVHRMRSWMEVYPESDLADTQLGWVAPLMMLFPWFMKRLGSLLGLEDTLSL